MGEVPLYSNMAGIYFRPGAYSPEKGIKLNVLGMKFTTQY